MAPPEAGPVPPERSPRQLGSGDGTRDLVTERRNLVTQRGALVPGRGSDPPRSAPAALHTRLSLPEYLAWKYGHYRPGSHRSDGSTS